MKLLQIYCKASRLSIFLCVLLLFLFWTQLSRRTVFLGRFQSFTSPDSNVGWKEIHPGMQSHSNENPGRALIEEIKKTTWLAAGAPESSDVAERSVKNEREAWERQNPCLSRLELKQMYNRRKYAKILPENPLWDELLDEYSKLHSTCTRKVGNLTNFFLSGNESSGCQFTVADIAPQTGLGNKFYVLVSSLLYSIVTRRVLLIPSANLVPEYTCEPFAGSSWVLDSESFPVPHFAQASQFQKSPWTFDGDFFQQVDKMMKEMDQMALESFKRGLIVPEKPLSHAVGVRTHEWQPSNRFYCSAEQILYSQATWVYLSGCIYTIPKLFVTPSFRPTLEALFPDKMVMTRLLRSIFLPSDDVWDRIRRIHHANLAGAERTVGIQVRFKDGVSHYEKMNTLVNERIMDCGRRNLILPDVRAYGRGSSLPLLHLKNSSVESPVLKVFVASLFPGLYEQLSRVYVHNPTLTGEDVGVVQVSEGHNQVFNSIEEDQQAFAEVLLLSFSDQLLVTPISTFGGLAQAYGALTPWFIEMREGRELESCERGQSVDVCNQFTEKGFICPHDPALNGQLFSDVVPYIKDCLPIDHSRGIQLITTFQS